MRALKNRTPFLVPKPNQFTGSEHQTTIILTETRKLMPTIIRLAELVAVEDPSRQYKLPIGNQEKLEVQIKAFRDLVNKQHFPLFGYGEEDELMDEQINEWEEGWIDQTYHPLLDQIPLRPLGFADHDISPSDYGELVALLYWLTSAKPELPIFNCKLKVDEHWSIDEQGKFEPTSVSTILSGMNLQAPLAYLPGLIKTVIKQTDTFFLDACPLCGNFAGPEFSWAVENFIWFSDDWQIAKPIHSGNQELIRWSNKSTERLAEISQIITKAHQINLFYKDE